MAATDSLAEDPDDGVHRWAAAKCKNGALLIGGRMRPDRHHDGRTGLRALRNRYRHDHKRQQWRSLAITGRVLKRPLLPQRCGGQKLCSLLPKSDSLLG